jgi:integrase
MEQLAQGSKRIRVIRKRFSAIISNAKDTEAEQSGITLRSYFEDWAAAKSPMVSPNYNTFLSQLKTELYAVLDARADQEIVHIDEEDVNEYVDTLEEKKLAPASVNKRLTALKEMFEDAMNKAFVIVNPVTDEHFQEKNPLERQCFPTPQVQLLLASTPLVDWQTVILFGYYCGMRLSDAHSQTWDAIDWERKVITWVPKKTRRIRKKKAKILISPLHPVLYEHLVRVKAMCGESPYVTPSLAKRSVSKLSEKFVDLVRASGIDPQPQLQPNGRSICLLTNHSLRHTFATELKRTGAPDKEWSRLTGHSLPFSRYDGERISHIAQIYNHVDGRRESQKGGNANR